MKNASQRVRNHRYRLNEGSPYYPDGFDETLLDDFREFGDGTGTVLLADLYNTKVRVTDDEVIFSDEDKVFPKDQEPFESPVGDGYVWIDTYDYYDDVVDFLFRTTDNGTYIVSATVYADFTVPVTRDGEYIYTDESDVSIGKLYTDGSVSLQPVSESRQHRKIRRKVNEARFTAAQVNKAKQKAQKTLVTQLEKLDLKYVNDTALDIFWHRSNPDYWGLLADTANKLRKAADAIEKDGKAFIDKYYDSDIAPDVDF